MDYKKLKIWDKAMEVSEETYLVTSALPVSEKFGLASQMKRAAVSIPSNIAEGAGRDGINEFRQFIRYAIGSLYELETQLELGKRIGIIKESTKLETGLFEFRKMIHSFNKKLKISSSNKQNN